MKSMGSISDIFHGEERDEGPPIASTQADSWHPQEYIFIISHIRSYSSLLAHILGSHCDISGYSEAHLSYRNPNDLFKLQQKVSSATDLQVFGRFVLDKVLGPKLQISDSVLNNDRVHSIFLLRNPEDTIKSILNMGINLGTKNEWHKDVEKAVSYYIDTLRHLEAYSLRLKKRALCIDSEHILDDSERTLSKVEGFLGLKEPLRATYSMFKYTGVPGHGDPSPVIKQGTLIPQKNSYNFHIPAEMLAQAQTSYENCRGSLLIRVSEPGKIDTAQSVPHRSIPLVSWSKRSQVKRTNSQILKKLRSRRRALSENYLKAPEDEFQQEVDARKDAYFALMESDVKKQALSEEEQDFLNDVLKQEFDQAKGLQYLFVAMLYCSPHQLPQKWRSRLSAPTWAAVYLHAWLNRGLPPLSVSNESRLVNQLYEYARSYPDSKGTLQSIRAAFFLLEGVKAHKRSNHTQRGQFIPFFKARILYTPVPKCACSSVKHFIFECERDIPYSRETTGNGKHIHQFYNAWNKILKDYAFADNWLKVLIVRDPVQRLISCYKDKVRYRQILLSCQDELAEAGVAILPDFDTFVDKLELYRSLNGNIKHHTDPIVVFADSPDCYDVVLNLTELNSLPVLVADRSGCHMKTMPHKRKRGNTLKVEQLNHQTVEKIRQFYACDYDMYGQYF